MTAAVEILLHEFSHLKIKLLSCDIRMLLAIHMKYLPVCIQPSDVIAAAVASELLAYPSITDGDLTRISPCIRGPNDMLVFRSITCENIRRVFYTVIT